MERTQIFDLMSALKLFGMRTAYDDVMAAGIKRQHEPPQIVGDLLASYEPVRFWKLTFVVNSSSRSPSGPMSEPNMKPNIYLVSSSLNESGVGTCALANAGKTISNAALMALIEKGFTSATDPKGSRPDIG